MSLRDNKQEWEEMALVDPLWAILSDPEKQRGGWNLGEFFQTGEVEVENVLNEARLLGYPHRHDAALDFGCGVGRATRAVASRFEQCWGLDISERMIRQAEELNADRQNITFLVNDSENLRGFHDNAFDFVYCNLVLQHLPHPRLARGYIQEFIRVLRPGGILVFQLPYSIGWRQRLQLRRRLYAMLHALGLDERFLYGRTGLNPIRMIAIPESETRRLVEASGGAVADALPPAVQDPNMPSLRYYVYKLSPDYPVRSRQ